MSQGHGVLQVVRNSPMGRRVLGVLAACLLVSSSVGCYGRFPITNAIYEWNGRVTNNHVVNSIIMVVLAILPVYGLAMLIDAVVINSIEFWEGKKLDVAQTYTQPDGSTVVLAPGSNENEAILTVLSGETIVAQRTFVRDAQGVTTVLNEQGTVVSLVTPDGNGGFAFSNANGEATGALSAEQVASLREGNAHSDVLLQGAAL